MIDPASNFLFAWNEHPSRLFFSLLPVRSLSPTTSSRCPTNPDTCCQAFLIRGLRLIQLDCICSRSKPFYSNKLEGTPTTCHLPKHPSRKHVSHRLHSPCLVPRHNPHDQSTSKATSCRHERSLVRSFAVQHVIVYRCYALFRQFDGQRTTQGHQLGTQGITQ